ncbi:peptidoglycan-associated lipoprotein Pal [Limibaculum sp. M0105]|uniref:Peptidoglycan-associated lipoprotein n=1 Tax=Thermohalobaculum xanthum TaxID=2753746 RepID=A0A8J7SGZ2_9RHOB|nr:peptidoglycan-associated lipoprotein Pal [Thermohalobaculum xanthum]MBK0399350.1 peptidoglycan-associated lipoprotein Pal [Thermohalobaculum xanthum]
MKIKAVAALGLVALLAACAGDDAVDASAGAGAGGAGVAGQPDPSTIAYFNQVVGDRVFFAFDSSEIDSQAQATLAQQAQWFRNNPAATATIEGHTDERGTRDYNLALGARRANAARAFLISQGVQADRLRTVSYGKERPVALCSDESCWAQNRRAVSVVVGAPTS